MKRPAVVLVVLGLWCFAASPAGALTNDTFFSEGCKASTCAFQWGLERVGAEYAWPVAEGNGVMIAVIDSGVDKEHPDLEGKLLPGRDFVGPGDDNPDDENGHGTLVAGISAAATRNGKGIAAVAPKAQTLPVRVFDVSGTATAEDVVQGIDYAVDEASSRNMSLVLNLSFEGDQEGLADPSTLLADLRVRQAIENAASSGAAVSIAAGNDSRSTTSYDAQDGRGILVVGASDSGDNRASFSNYGAGLDLLAPGVEITSTFWDSDTNRSVYATAGGTSMSVPFVAGTAALLMSTGKTNVQAMNQILASAKDLGTPGRDNTTGYGLLDTAAALGAQRPGPKPSSKPSPPPAQIVSPSPSPTPSPLVLPSPGEPPELLQPAGSPDPIFEIGPKASSPRESRRPLRPAAIGLAGLAAGLHLIRLLWPRRVL